MDHSKKILLICYSFPPYPGIGGRRWAKFAKYLKRNGNDVYVICAKNPHLYDSSWNKDVEGVEIHQLPVNYPLPLILFPTNILGRISYKLSLLKVKLFSKGNYYDKTLFWKEQLQNKCIEIIVKYKIKNIICSVGPFNMSQYAIELKKKFPDVNFILDYRDPWSNNETSFGFTSISLNRLNYEKQVEKFVLNNYDKVIGVSQQFSEYFKEITQNENFEKKYFTLPNGYDKEDTANKSEIKIPNINADDIIIVYAGTFYDKSIHLLKKIDSELKQLAHNLKFVFLGTIPNEGLDIIKNNNAFTWLGKKTLQETNYIISKADYCSLFLTNDLDYSFSTKFYEYISHDKKILTFSKRHGYNAQFVEENKIGYGINFENMKERLVRISEEGKPTPINKGAFNVSIFDIKNLTKELEKLLE